ncbi:MAG: LOG family protein [Anaerolineae bacterium]|nr:LOG family protein [Anaerolineae bacterium]
MNIKRCPIIGVVGKKDFEGEFKQYEPIAYEVGKAIDSKGYWLLCGGLGGVMEAAARGANEAGGLTIGILPTAIAKIDEKKSDEWPNSYIDVAIFTGLGGGVDGRNKVIVSSCDAIIALPGSSDTVDSGTLSEIKLALDNNVPIIPHRYWQTQPKLGLLPGSERLQYFDNATEAVEMAIEAIKRRSGTTKPTTSRR